MRKICVALVLCLLTLAALAGCGESSAKTVTSNGVECYRVDGVCYPAVFGEPQLTGEEITALLDGGDTAEMAVTVSTVPDALRLLKARQQDSEDIDSQDAETTLLHGSSQPRGWVDALLYLLAGDCEESGRIDLYSSSNYSAYAAIAQDGLYYAFDPFEIRGDCWLVLSGENYVNADAQKLADMLRTACGFSTSAYTANAYPALSKEEQEQRKAFEQREYTDEEIQALASAGLTLDEAADKLHTFLLRQRQAQAVVVEADFDELPAVPDGRRKFYSGFILIYFHNEPLLMVVRKPCLRMGFPCPAHNNIRRHSGTGNPLSEYRRTWLFLRFAFEKEEGNGIWIGGSDADGQNRFLGENPQQETARGRSPSPAGRIRLLPCMSSFLLP